MKLPLLANNIINLENQKYQQKKMLEKSELSMVARFEINL